MVSTIQSLMRNKYEFCKSKKNLNIVFSSIELVAFLHESIKIDILYDDNKEYNKLYLKTLDHLYEKNIINNLDWKPFEIGLIFENNISLFVTLLIIKKMDFNIIANIYIKSYISYILMKYLSTEQIFIDKLLCVMIKYDIPIIFTDCSLEKTILLISEYLNYVDKLQNQNIATKNLFCNNIFENEFPYELFSCLEIKNLTKNFYISNLFFDRFEFMHDNTIIDFGHFLLDQSIFNLFDIFYLNFIKFIFLNKKNENTNYMIKLINLLKIIQNEIIKYNMEICYTDLFNYISSDEISKLNFKTLISLNLIDSENFFDALIKSSKRDGIDIDILKQKYQKNYICTTIKSFIKYAIDNVIYLENITDNYIDILLIALQENLYTDDDFDAISKMFKKYKNYDYIFHKIFNMDDNIIKKIIYIFPDGYNNVLTKNIELFNNNVFEVNELINKNNLIENITLLKKIKQMCTSDNTECKICINNNINCCLDCGHTLCMDCANKINLCPWCKNTLLVVKKIYL